ncbi:MAG TPA: class I SAM-dependent methyltransferase [Candidatus Dormibacteraeota bacterium]
MRDRSHQLGQAGEVRAHFRATAAYWHDLYRRGDPIGIVFQDRQEAALAMIGGLELPTGSPVLEAGCGSGFVTVDLARRGLQVTAVDAAPEMLAVARGVVAENGLAAAVQLRQADVHDLDFPDRSFRLVVALGLIPWLHSPGGALAELARVLVPGGHLLVTSDNRARLNHLADPAFSPLLASPRRAASAIRRRLTNTPADPRFHPHLIWTWRFRKLVERAGLEIVSERTVGFGPFSFLAHPLLQGGGGVAVHRKLQSLADRGFPLVRSTGSHHIVLARKPPASE